VKSSAHNILGFFLAYAVACSAARAEESASTDEAARPAASSRPARVRVFDTSKLAGLPSYHFNIDLDTEAGTVAVIQRVRWTNPGPEPTDHIVLHVVPNNRPTEDVLFIARRTVESLRLDPRDCLDEKGGRFHLREVKSSNDDLRWHFEADHDTHLHIALPKPVAVGETAEVELNYWLDLPPIQGRLGQFKGVTNLLNWCPVLAVYGNTGWDAVPYVPWHQPWLNEAGNYEVRLRVTPGQRVATGGRVVDRSFEDSGHQVLEIRGQGLRDFTIVASDRFELYESHVDGVPVRVLAFPEHQGHARLALQIAGECLQQYSEWFGPYPYDEFELVESFFGWNGNESSGLVMIDERILDTPQLASRYVEHLISHEICHQWWYSAVGTDGYREPWVDEGIVQWLTRVRLEDKYGANPKVFDFKGYGPLQLPNIHYRSLVHSGYSLYQKRGGDAQALAPLDEIGHLHNLFFLVYDRGARVVGMIQHRMGREDFFRFMRHLYGKYQFGILRAADIQRELEEFTGHSWQTFFDDWLRSGRDSDWKIDDVDVSRSETGYITRATLIQTEDITEPIDLSFCFDCPTGAGRTRIVRLDDSWRQVQSETISIERPTETQWIVTVHSPDAPDQIEIDPEGWVLDTNPRNNRWKPDIDFRISPFYTPLDEAALTQPWQKASVVTGFGIDGDGRVGLRSALISSNEYRVSPFLGYTANSNNDYLSAGIDAIFYNVPAPNWELGVRYEKALLTNLENDPGDQARIYVRKVLQYTTSLIYPNLSYFDIYTRFGDNFFPDRTTMRSSDPRVQRFDDVRAFGFAFHADSQLPYWNPDSGFVVDAGYEHGFHAFDDGATYDRVTGKFGTVHRLPDDMGWLSETKLAARISAGYGWDDTGEHFRFGGPGRFRGRNPNETASNAWWVGTLEWRFPITGELDYQVVDNMAALRSIDAALFYDVGESFLFDETQGVDHAIGLGIYYDIPLLSFVENLTVRVEYGRSVTNDTGVFWFGLYRAF